jgi:F0F1-type ATP synthase assembly protein I
VADKASSVADDLSHSAAAKYNKGKKVASHKADQAKDKAIETRDDLSANRDNPVVVANAVLIAATAVGLGVGAYHKHKLGELNWGLVGTWAGVVGLFAAADYLVSQYLFKNKYPKK